MVDMLNSIRRAWGYSRYGINNFVGWLVSLTAYITIIYELVPGFKDVLPVYLVVPLTLLLILGGSCIIGYFLIKHAKAWGGELEIGAEAQPYNFKLLNGKERLSWELMLNGYQLQIKQLKVWESLYPNRGFGDLTKYYEKMVEQIQKQLNAKGEIPREVQYAK